MSKQNLMDDNCFVNEITNLQNDKTKTFAISGNEYVRRKVYEYCKENNLKTTKTRGKVCVVVCREHKCICVDRTNEEFRCYRSYGSCERCITCNYSCPKSFENDYGCEFVEARPKLPVIYIHKEDIPIEKLRELDRYPLSIDLY